MDIPISVSYTHLDRTWAASPINLITWAANNGQIKMNLNLPAIIGLTTQDGETPIDPGLISGITEALEMCIRDRDFNPCALLSVVESFAKPPVIVIPPSSH